MNNIQNLPDNLKIQDSTPVHEFPGKYSDLIAALNSRIDTLNSIIAAKDNEITTLKSKFNSALNTLRAEYLRMFDELESKYGLKPINNNNS